jgi:small GTP-binding protein
MQEKATFRTVMIGDASVGKTSILNKFLRDAFDPHELNTIGAFYDSFSRERHGRQIEVELWDTAGQEEYRALGPVYFRNSAAALVVYDVTSRETFSHLGNWIESFTNVTGDDASIILIGNKVDKGKREVESTEAADWAGKRRSPYFETSAATGEGLECLFDNLVDRLAERVVGAPTRPNLLQRPVARAEPEGCC